MAGFDAELAETDPKKMQPDSLEKAMFMTVMLREKEKEKSELVLETKKRRPSRGGK